MALNNINFQLGQDGLGRLPANEDHVSALVFDQAQPAFWGTDKMKEFRSLRQVQQSGIAEYDPTFGLVHYQAKEFFRQNPNATLWVAFDVSAFEIKNFSQGKIRQIGIEYPLTLGNINGMQTVCESLRAEKAPCIAIMGATGISDIGAISPSLHPRNLATELVSVVIAGDDANEGAALATALGLDYVPAYGAVLGASSRARVSDSIAWVQQFDFARTELDSVRFADGSSLSNYTDSDLGQINDWGFLFFRKFTGRAGTYLNDTHTATEAVSDYAYIEANRTIQKAERLAYSALLPQLNSPVTVDADGSIAPSTVSFFESLIETTIRQNMLSNQELSGFSVTIDPAQNVLQTSTIEVDLTLQPIGVARNFLVKLGFALNI
jgi:hypothetical protein